MWSIAGVVTRHLEAARGFEVTFWRSAFNALALVRAAGAGCAGPAPLAASLRGGGRTLWLSGLCWAVMYTAFMLALTLTTVANVLVTMALGAAVHRAAGARRARPPAGGAHLGARSCVAGAGIAWMYAREVSGSDPRHLLGTLVALARADRRSGQLDADPAQPRRRAAGHAARGADRRAALGGRRRCCRRCPSPRTRARPGAAGAARRGAAGHSLPAGGERRHARCRRPRSRCSACSRWCSACCGPGSGANEAPAASVLGGGLLVLAALAGNELLALRERSRLSDLELRQGFPSRTRLSRAA